MTDEKVTQGGGDEPNPPKEQGAKAPEQTPNPSDQGSADLKTVQAQLDEVTQKLDRYKEQVKGSSEEALRLKEENDKLKTDIDSLQKSGSANDQGTFQKIMEEQGLEAAIFHVVNNRVASLSERVETFETNEAEKILTKFRASHEALNDAEVLAKFDAELGKLKNVYTDVYEAMEKAYTLAVGKPSTQPVKPKVEDDPQKKENENKVVKNVVGGEEDKKPAKPVNNSTEIQTQINDLQYEAMTLQNQGRTRQAAELLAKADELRSSLGEKV